MGREQIERGGNRGCIFTVSGTRGTVEKEVDLEVDGRSEVGEDNLGELWS